MRKQRNMFQMKEQDKSSGKHLNDTKISNLLGKEFKGMITKMLTELERKKDKHMKPSIKR